MNDAISSMIRGADNLGRFQRDVYRRALTVQGEALAEAERERDAALTLARTTADSLREVAAERDVAIGAREALEASLRQVAEERDALKSAPSFRARVIASLPETLVIAAAERLVDDDGRGLRDLAIAVRDLRNIRD
jgi:hypothetical protein